MSRSVSIVDVSLYGGVGAAMQRAFLPAMGSPSIPSGTAFQAVCTRDKRLYIARRVYGWPHAGVPAQRSDQG
jgi:hypothetical protein